MVSREGGRGACVRACVRWWIGFDFMVRLFCIIRIIATPQRFDKCEFCLFYNLIIGMVDLNSVAFCARLRLESNFVGFFLGGRHIRGRFRNTSGAHNQNPHLVRVKGWFPTSATTKHQFVGQPTAEGVHPRLLYGGTVQMCQSPDWFDELRSDCLRGVAYPFRFVFARWRLLASALQVASGGGQPAQWSVQLALGLSGSLFPLPSRDFEKPAERVAPIGGRVEHTHTPCRLAMVCI